MNSAVSVDIHLTNVVGTGASYLVSSLLPHLEQESRLKITRLYLPDRGSLSAYTCLKPSTQTVIYKRWLHNAVSRFLECTLLAKQFKSNSVLLVLGDIPLMCGGKQIVLVQTTHVLCPDKCSFSWKALYYGLIRFIFKLNHKQVSSFIVQTDYMRQELERSYPAIKGKVRVICPPVPSWLISAKINRTARVDAHTKLKLMYPADNYPHKNHALLSLINKEAHFPIQELILTLASSDNPAPHLDWVQCVGFMSPQDMIAAYTQVDALLFLSQTESYGFPLVEAMFIGIPIICPDLPYAHILCGEQAIYFEPTQADSLLLACDELYRRLACGWWPRWEANLATLSINWEGFARQMADVCLASYKESTQLDEIP